MKLPGPPLPQFLLKPGELVITAEPQWVVTVLGSCVAVTMFNARFHLAAICHAMLPRPPAKEAENMDSILGPRYLSLAIPAMIARFSQLGLGPEEVEVKIFGGGNVIRMGRFANDPRTVGSANIALAQELLQSARFRIKAHSFGGNRGSKIAFNTVTGEVLHKHLRRESVTA